MKRIVWYGFLAFICMALFCSFADQSKVYESFSGTVHFYGNEPVVFAGLVTDTGDEYSLAVFNGEDGRGPAIPNGYTAITDKNQFTKFSASTVEFLGFVQKKASKDKLNFKILKDGTFAVFAYKVIE